MMFLHVGITGLLGWLLPSVTQSFYQNFTGDVLTPFIYVGALFLGEYLNRLGYQLSTYKFVTHLLSETRTKTFSLWMHAPLRTKRKGRDEDFPMGEVLARIMSDTDAVKELVTSGAFAIAIDFVFIIASLVGFLRINGSVGTGLFVIEVLACILLVWGSRKMGEIFASVSYVTGLVSRVVADVSHGLRELAFTPHVRYASRRGDKVFDEFLAKQLKANIWDAGYYSAAESLYPILLALVLFFFPHGEMASMAMLAVLIDLIQKSISPIKEVAGKISSIQRAATGLERIQEFHRHFAGENVIASTPVSALENFSLHLTSYVYPPREGEAGFNLSEVKFSGSPGELIGIVGVSGCGKSTLLRLLSGQHGSFEGQVCLNDTVLDMEKPQDLHRLRQFVSLVSQDSHVFSASVLFNIALTQEAADFVDFWNQARAVLPYLRRWDIGPSTLIDPKTLSLGQKQLLSGLRACYLHKPIVLFDEVSSGLDPDLEKALRDLVLFVQRRSLTIIVTHRLETILSAQQLIVMAAGRVIDQGTPQALTERSPLFGEFLSQLRK